MENRYEQRKQVGKHPTFLRDCCMCGRSTFILFWMEKVVTNRRRWVRGRKSGVHPFMGNVRKKDGLGKP
jgi:hypothetical protein